MAFAFAFQRKSVSGSGSEVSEASSSQPSFPIESCRLAAALSQIRELETSQKEWSARMKEMQQIGQERSDELENLRSAHKR